MKKLNTSKLKEMGKSFTTGAKDVLMSKETYIGTAIGLVLFGGLEESLEYNIKVAATNVILCMTLNGTAHVVTDLRDSKDKEVLTED